MDRAVTHTFRRTGRAGWGNACDSSRNSSGGNRWHGDDARECGGLSFPWGARNIVEFMLGADEQADEDRTE